jgi:transposase
MTDLFSAPQDQVASYFVGIDVAKAKLDLARTDRADILTVTNDAAGIALLIKSFGSVPPDCIVSESTGGLERPLIDALVDAGLPVALVNPGRVRHFAKAMSILAKNDPIDARVLARFAQVAAPRLSEKRTANQAEIDALVTCRRQLVQTRTAQTNRRGTTTSKTALKAIDRVIKTLNLEIAALDLKIHKLIESDHDLGDKSKRLQSVPGVGAVLSSTLIGELRELGSTNHRRISALVGIAPYDNDSGPRTGKRSIRGGRTHVRSTLYMATLSVMRFNPVIKPFADRLKAAGKQPKVVIVACMRKLLTLLNVMIRDGLEWSQLSVVKALALAAEPNEARA